MLSKNSSGGSRKILLKKQRAENYELSVEAGNIYHTLAAAEALDGNGKEVMTLGEHSVRK
jgi:hypothetical protein